jgi:hypothetical protein
VAGRELLDFYTEPGPFTTLSATAAQVDGLPTDVGVLAATVQNLLVHRFWAQAYKVEVSDERDREQGVHSAEGTIACAMRLRDALISDVRLAEHRAVGICRHFATVMCAFLRRKGISARARCGFATYFEAGKYGDHWVCEYWNQGEERWVLVDAQLDPLQRAVLKPDFDPLDVPRDRFLVAGKAWQLVRAAEADGSAFGIADMWGQWYIVGNLTLDLLALQGIEMLPWEALHLYEGDPTDDDLALVDRLAALTLAADEASMAELRRMSASDARLGIAPGRIEELLSADASGATTANPVTMG